MKQFEYLVKESYPEEFELNELGAQGWELIHITESRYIYKREKQQGFDDSELDRPIDFSQLTFRPTYYIRNMIQAKTYRDLCNVGRVDMMKYRNIGKKSRTEIDELMEREGLTKYWL